MAKRNNPPCRNNTKIKKYEEPSANDIAKIMRERCLNIKRPNLAEITEKDVEIKKFNDERGLCYVTVFEGSWKQMTYVVCINPENTSLSVWHGGNIVAGSGRPRKKATSS